jgi:hypothetical protein
MRPISKKLRTELEADPYYKKCAASRSAVGGLQCIGKIEWHNPFIYQGKQINEKWAIDPLCEIAHEEIKNHLFLKQDSQRRCLLRATDEDLAKYPKFDWKQLKIKLGIEKQLGDKQ